MTYWSDTRLVDLCIRPFCCVTVVEEGIGCAFKEREGYKFPLPLPPNKATHPDITSTLHNFTHSKVTRIVATII